MHVAMLSASHTHTHPPQCTCKRLTYTDIDTTLAYMEAHTRTHTRVPQPELLTNAQTHANAHRACVCASARGRTLETCLYDGGTGTPPIAHRQPIAAPALSSGVIVRRPDVCMYVCMSLISLQYVCMYVCLFLITLHLDDAYTQLLYNLSTPSTTKMRRDDMGAAGSRCQTR
eukprot:GHVU01142049.1.p1 GENE.GHVU01142049.1~~GHVU01142049.1.p1  ORF type:complete len:172 (-),score=9.88 GHVU01142049.1:181-696(-)